MTQHKRPKVVIIGAGFGGLYAARQLANQSVDVLLIDRHNFHTFTPLLYQVATCALDPSEVAYPVRRIFRKNANIGFLLGEIIAIDREQKQVFVKTDGKAREEAYDYLIVAAGTVTNYFGNAHLEQYAFGLKSLADAVVLRNHILKLFEKATWTDNQSYKTALKTLVVVGGGPTGLETAGALYELYNYVLRHEYAQVPDMDAKVILLEASNRLLMPYPDRLQKAALDQLRSLGVDVILDSALEEAGSDFIRLKDGRVIPTYTVVWAAGVKASPIASMLNIPLQRGGRVPVEPSLQVVGDSHIYAIGDIAYLEDPKGQPYAQVIQVAQQQGKLAGRNLLKRIRGEEQQKFEYFDLGLMATIGRSRAVAWIFNRIQLRGFIAWVAWVWLHLITLIGFRNRAVVFISWVWNYLTYDRSVRIILEHSPHRVDAMENSPAEPLENVEG